MKKIIGMFVIMLGVFALAGFASASTADSLQPASDVTYNENLTVNGTGIFDSIKVGKQGVGGVTFFNGTIINTTTDEDGNGIPVTFGDDVRIDGEIFRTEVGGSNNLKISDTLQPTTTGVYDLGASSKKFNDGYFAGDLDVDGSIVVDGDVDGVDVSDEVSVWYSTDADSIGDLPAPATNPTPSKIISGTADVPACDDPDDAEGGAFGVEYVTIELPTNFYSDTATYAVNVTPLQFIRPFYSSVGAWRTDQDTFVIAAECQDFDIDAYVFWTAVGY